MHSEIKLVTQQYTISNDGLKKYYISWIIFYSLS